MKKNCNVCGGKVKFHKDDECPGCHYLECEGCHAMIDLSYAVDPENKCETLEELRALITEKWEENQFINIKVE